MLLNGPPFYGVPGIPPAMRIPTLDARGASFAAQNYPISHGVSRMHDVDAILGKSKNFFASAQEIPSFSEMIVVNWRAMIR